MAACCAPPATTSRYHYISRETGSTALLSQQHSSWAKTFCFATCERPNSVAGTTNYLVRISSHASNTQGFCSTYWQNLRSLKTPPTAQQTLLPVQEGTVVDRKRLRCKSAVLVPNMCDSMRVPCVALCDVSTRLLRTNA